MTRLNRATKRVAAFALLALAALALAPVANADPIKVTPLLVAFKQYGPKVIAFVFAVDMKEAIPAGYLPFVHVVDKAHPGPKDVVFQTSAGIPGTPDKWPVGQVSTGALTFANVPEGLADGEYDIRLGLYDAVKGPRLELTGADDGSRRYTVGKIVVAGATITAPGINLPTPAQEGRLNVVPSATDLAQTGPRSFSYRVVFDVNDKIPAGYRLFIHATPLVVTKDRDIMFQTDPAIATLPETWAIDQKVTGNLATATLPTDLADGTYTLRIGMYNPTANGIRAKLSGLDDGGQRFAIARFVVAGSKITVTKP